MTSEPATVGRSCTGSARWSPPGSATTRASSRRRRCWRPLPTGTSRTRWPRSTRPTRSPAAQEVLGDRGGGPHGDVEAARPAVDAVAAPDVGLGVEQQQDVRVAVRPGRGDVELAGARRDAPVDAAQPVARAERADLGRLAAAALAVGAVQPDEPGRSRHGVGGVELGAQRQRREHRSVRRRGRRCGTPRASTCRPPPRGRPGAGPSARRGSRSSRRPDRRSRRRHAPPMPVASRCRARPGRHTATTSPVAAAVGPDGDGGRRDLTFEDGRAR